MPFEAKPSRIRVAGLLVLAAGFVVCALWILGAFGSAPDSGIVHRLASWVMLVLGVGAILRAVRWLFESGVIVRVDDQGIYWRRGSPQLIPWSAIAAIRPAQTRNQRFVCLDLYDPAAYSSHGVAGRLRRINQATGFGDITISMIATDRGFDDLLAAIERFAPAGLRGAP